MCEMGVLRFTAYQLTFKPIDCGRLIAAHWLTAKFSNGTNVFHQNWEVLLTTNHLITDFSSSKLVASFNRGPFHCRFFSCKLAGYV
jgi:hypothetical protein